MKNWSHVNNKTPIIIFHAETVKVATKVFVKKEFVC